MSKAPPKTRCACGCGTNLELYWVQVADKLFAGADHYARWIEAEAKGIKRFNAQEVKAK